MDQDKNQRVDYTQLGYDRYFRKSQQPEGGAQDPYFLQALSSSQNVQGADTSLLQQVPGNVITGGAINSPGGNMSIDLSNNTFTYTDGVTNLLQIDPVNGLIINNAQGQPLVQTGSASQGGG